jgi:hypothetical protein
MTWTIPTATVAAIGSRSTRLNTFPTITAVFDEGRTLVESSS